MVSEYFFQNPEVFAIAIGFIVCLVTFSVLSRRFDKGSSILIGLVVGILTAYNLFINDFYGWEETLVFVIYLVVIALVIKIFIPFFKSVKR